MVKTIYRCALWLGLLALPLGCSLGKPSADAPPSAEPTVELMVSAAASLKDALQEIKDDYERDNPDVEIRYIFGGSGKLATQIERGAPSDAFLSASEKEMDRLQRQGLIDADSRVAFASNVLVLIANKDNPPDATSFEQIDPDNIARMAIGEPKTAPVGRYTEAALRHLGKWDSLREKLAMASDARQALAYVESGNADVGVVYASDAIRSDKVQVIAEANEAWHDPIVYPGAVIANATNAEEARAFLRYVASERGKETLVRYGFK